MIDPLADSPWSMESTVQGFVRSLPNDTLLRFADAERRRVPNGRLLDIGCGAGRNAVALARRGWHVLGVDLSWPMLEAARGRAQAEGDGGRMHLALAPMDALPARPGAFDLIVAHGIWNLARSAREFRAAVGAAARAAAPGAGLFVFTFSRDMLPPDLEPIHGEPFAFAEFSGTPQTFLTREQLEAELLPFGFVPDYSIPFSELNRPPAGSVHALRTPVVLEGAFRMTGRAVERFPSVSA